MTAMLYAIVLCGVSALAGLMGGLTGTGGIIIPPIMISLFGTAPAEAMGSAQASYFIPSCLAVLMFLRKRQFDRRVALPLAGPGCLSCFIGANYLKPVFNPSVLTIFFGLCMVVSGLVMLRKWFRTGAREIDPARCGPALMILGGVVGLLSGITGSGSNAILVPTMVYMGLDMLVVLSACQLFSVLAAFAGTIGNTLNLAVNFHDVLWLMVGQIAGIWCGVWLAQRLNTEKLKLYVGVVCTTCGLFIVARAGATML